MFPPFGLCFCGRTKCTTTPSSTWTPTLSILFSWWLITFPETSSLWEKTLVSITGCCKVYFLSLVFIFKQVVIYNPSLETIVIWNVWEVSFVWFWLCFLSFWQLFVTFKVESRKTWVLHLASCITNKNTVCLSNKSREPSNQLHLQLKYYL